MGIIVALYLVMCAVSMATEDESDGMTVYEKRQTCPQYWEYREEYDYCLGPIGEYTDFYTHTKTCKQQHDKGVLFMEDDEMKLQDVCIYGMYYFPTGEGKYFFLGASRDGDNFKWVHNGEIVQIENWGPGEPDGSKSNPQECLVMSLPDDEDRNCQIYDFNCNDSANAVCQIHGPKKWSQIAFPDQKAGNMSKECSQIAFSDQKARHVKTGNKSMECSNTETENTDHGE